MFVYLDTVNKWDPGTAGKLTYDQFTQRMEIATKDPIQYMTKTTKKQDDTERLKAAYAQMKARGIENPSLEDALAIAIRSR